MGYTYKGKDYPKELYFNFPEIKVILSKPKDDITFGEASHLLSRDADKMQEDCLNLILNEIGNQREKTLEMLQKDPAVNPYIINNTLIFLCAYFWGYDEPVSKVLLELLRQSKDFLDFNNIEVTEDFQHAPIATSTFICYSLNPNSLLGLLLENDISEEGKKIATEMIGSIATYLRKCPDGVESDVHKELCQSLKDAFNKYAKDYPDNGILDKTSLSHLIEAMSLVGVNDFGNVELPMAVRHLFFKGYIDDEIINEDDAIDGMCDNGWDCEIPVTDVRELLFPASKGD